MHILEQYALSSGLKIGKPFVYEVFFPIESKKYITLQKEVKFPSRQYKYWQQVVDLVNPILFKNNVKIVQIGSKNDKALKGVVYTSGETSIAQVHYLIRNSQMHVGIDSFAVHIASCLGKKIVALYSNMTPENSGPYWSNTLDCILIQSPRGDAKPSYAVDENPRTINEIKPETIANSILQLLDIEERVKIETLFIGENFNEETYFGFLPNQTVFSGNAFPEIRMDLLFDEGSLIIQLIKQKSIITTDRPIKEEILLKCKPNIAKIIYLIKENDDPSFVKFLFEKGFPFSCVSQLPLDTIKAKSLNYYRFCSIEEHAITKREQDILPILKADKSKEIKFKSNYIISSNGKEYLSEYYFLKNEAVENKNDFSLLNTCDASLSDIKNFWIIKELN